MNAELHSRKNMHRLHAAIIMDGNGRWAQSRGLPRAEGHRAGAEAIPAVVAAAPALGVETLTLYAFSQNNWDRPAEEVDGLMRLFETFFRGQREDCPRAGVRLSVIGRRDRLPTSLRAEIECCEAASQHGPRLHLRLALDYSGRGAILDAARRLGPSHPASPEEFSRLLAQAMHADPDDQDVDLLIRTGREQRLSDFLLWEAAYAELFFSPVYWPDFTPLHLREAIENYHRRQRRFGRLRPAEDFQPALECALTASQ
jgi:undecaprenyl diphosphate synthase